VARPLVKVDGINSVLRLPKSMIPWFRIHTEECVENAENAKTREDCLEQAHTEFTRSSSVLGNWEKKTKRCKMNLRKWFIRIGGIIKNGKELVVFFQKYVSCSPAFQRYVSYSPGELRVTYKKYIVDSGALSQRLLTPRRFFRLLEKIVRFIECLREAHKATNIMRGKFLKWRVLWPNARKRRRVCLPSV
jgi:hypothetical protein